MFAPHTPHKHPLSPIQVLPNGSGQAPAHILAAEDEGPAGEEAGQGLCPAPGGGEGEAPAGEGPPSRAEAGAHGAELGSTMIGLGPGEAPFWAQRVADLAKRRSQA